MVDDQTTKAFVEANFETFLNGLSDFIRLPNLTPSCSKTYLEDGLVEKAFDCVDEYVQKLNIKGLTQSTYNNDKKAGPLRIYNVEAKDAENLTGYKHIMLYGHLDKQPHGAGWETSPTDPVIVGEKLLGRGSADDGYSAFLGFLAIKNLQEQGVPTPRFTIFLESEEESGSPNINLLMDLAKEAIGNPEIIFILDSSALDYRSLWVTETMRGIVNCDVEIDVLSGGVHSGAAGGIVPEPFRILRVLMDRIEDASTGMVKLPELTSPVPESFKASAQAMVDDIGDELHSVLPFVKDVKPINYGNNLELYLRNTWHAAIAVIGFTGLPETKIAGNALNPKCTFRVSTRISPDRNPDVAAEALVKAFTEDCPYGAKITANANHRGYGYFMKDLPETLRTKLSDASKSYFDKECRYFGLGATIPLLTDLQSRFPDTTIIATGSLGMDSNAHGPNESLNLTYVKKFLGMFSQILGTI